jgi:tetratricopeptide (TPR) repeat protein
MGRPSIVDDNTSVSKSFEYFDLGSNETKRRWVTYDDQETLAIKYSAVLAAGVGGVGIWTADATHRNTAQDTLRTAAAMWNAVPVLPTWLPSLLKTDDLCATGPACAAEALSLLVDWQLGFEHGPGNTTTGLAYRSATVPRATLLAKQAVALAPRSSVAATAHSTALLLNFSWAPAAAEAQRAVSLNASDTDALQWLTKVQTAQQDMGAALSTAEKAIALAPDDPSLAVNAGAVLYFMEEYAALRDKLLPVVQRLPKSVAAWDWLAMAYKGMGNYTLALES